MKIILGILAALLGMQLWNAATDQAAAPAVAVPWEQVGSTNYRGACVEQVRDGQTEAGDADVYAAAAKPPARQVWWIPCSDPPPEHLR